MASAHCRRQAAIPLQRIAIPRLGDAPDRRRPHHPPYEALFSHDGNDSRGSGSRIVLSAQQGAGPVFEVATIKLNTSGVTSGGLSASGIVTFHNTTVRDLIRRAYDVPPERVVGGPEWLDRDLCDFTGKGEAEAPPARRMLMLRAFLADRLKLIARTQSRELPVLALVVARSDRRLGPQIRPSPLAAWNTRRRMWAGFW